MFLNLLWLELEDEESRDANYYLKRRIWFFKRPNFKFKVLKKLFYKRKLLDQLFVNLIFILDLIFFWYCVSSLKRYVNALFYRIISPSDKIYFFNSGDFFIGFFDFFKKFQIHGLSTAISLSFLFFSLFLHGVSLNKTLFFWMLGFGNIYWLLSTFTFFFKKYYYSKFTSANQKFWKRSLLLFWVLEFFLFSIFLFLTFNSSSESHYMLDNQQLFKLFLVPLAQFTILLVFASSLVIFCYLLMLSLKWQSFDRVIFDSSLLTLVLLFFVFFECYQFFHVINYYSNICWEYDLDTEAWVAELEARKTRTHHHYVFLLCILKFWHIIFICGVWVFFFWKAIEVWRIRYQSVAGNFHNFVFLYIFCWIFLFTWLKFLLKYLFTYSFDEFYVFGHSYFGFFFVKDLFLFCLFKLINPTRYSFSDAFFYFDSDRVLHSIFFYK